MNRQVHILKTEFSYAQMFFSLLITHLPWFISLYKNSEAECSANNYNQHYNG